MMNLIADWPLRSFPLRLGRSEGRYSHDTGQYGHYTTAYTAFGRYAGGVHPVARMLVEAYGRIIDVIFGARLASNTVCLVTGFTPLLAMVPAAMPSCWAVMPREHWRV